MQGQSDQCDFNWPGMATAEKNSFEEEMKGDPVIILPLSVSGYICSVLQELVAYINQPFLLLVTWFCKSLLPSSTVILSRIINPQAAYLRFSQLI